MTWNGHGDAQALWRIEASGSLTLANSFTYSTVGTPSTTTHNSIADLAFRYLYVGQFGVQWDDFGTGLALHLMSALCAAVGALPAARSESTGRELVHLRRQ